MATIYILNYNNYFNRRLKRSDNISDYLSSLVYTKEAVNYKPGDDVTMKQNITGDAVQVYYGNGDYCVIVEDNQIISRWFIMESVRKAFNSYDLTLRRDVLADYYYSFIDSPMFIDKGLADPSSPFVFNEEAITTNEIKQNEILLKDKTQMPWIVIYYARKSNEALTTLTATVQAATNFDISIDSTFENWKYAQYVNLPFVTEGDVSFSLKYYSQLSLSSPIRYHNTLTINNETGTWNRDKITVQGTGNPYQSGADNPQAIVDQLQTVKSTIHEQSKAYLNWKSAQETSDLLFYNGKTLRFVKGSGYEYRRITFRSSMQTSSVDVTAGSLFNTIQANTTLKGQSATDKYAFSMKSDVYNVIATAIDVGEYSINVGSTRYTTSDAPYDVLAIPYGNNPIWNGTTQIPNNAAVNMQIAMALAEKYAGSGTIYDVQLLPYCPIQSKIGQDGQLNLANDGSLFTTIKHGTADVGVAINCPVTSFSFTIDQSIKITNAKMQNQTQKCRIVSPNYNGQFEFNASRAGGINHFDIDCTYKPYNPYIAVSIHGGLYGSDFDDVNKTMICGGDFSLPIVTDQFKTYEIQNKNYQAIFDRQIQNMDVSRKYQRIEQIIGAETSAGVLGMSLGGMIGGPVGIAGGIAAAGMSAAAGAADVAISEQLYNEQRRYQKDIFTLQLGNVKALPNSISKTTAFNQNNKYFPFVEIYDCTDEEKHMVAEKIRWSGMTLGTVGTFHDQLNLIGSYRWSFGDIQDEGFVQGQLIQLGDLNKEYHIAEQIYIELAKGVYTR